MNIILPVQFIVQQYLRNSQIQLMELSTNHTEKSERSQQNSQFESLSVSEINAPSSVSNEESAEQNIFYNQSEGNLVGHYNQAVDLDQTLTEEDYEMIKGTIQAMQNEIKKINQKIDAWIEHDKELKAQMNVSILLNEQNVKENTIAIEKLDKRVGNVQNRVDRLQNHAFGSVQQIQSQQILFEPTSINKIQTKQVQPYKIQQIYNEEDIKFIKNGAFSAEARIAKFKQISYKFAAKMVKVEIQQYNHLWKMLKIKNNRLSEEFRRLIIQSVVFVGDRIFQFQNNNVYYGWYHFLNAAHAIAKNTQLIWFKNQDKMLGIDKLSDQMFNYFVISCQQVVKELHQKSEAILLIKLYIQVFLPQTFFKNQQKFFMIKFDEYVCALPFLQDRKQYRVKRCLLLCVVQLILEDLNEDEALKKFYGNFHEYYQTLIKQTSKKLRIKTIQKRKELYK